MPRARKVCNVHSCPDLLPPGARDGRCVGHQREGDRDRGTAAQRGYTGKGHRAFRRAVIAKHPICQLCRIQPSTDADHWPIGRGDLGYLGYNPNDPKHGRGLCSHCHKVETAKHQPGGWHTHHA